MPCGNSPSSTKPRVIVDAVYGDIHFDEREWRIINTPVFQRLRNIKQLQMSHLTYPNSTHTRFAHSLGVKALMDKIIVVAERHGTLSLDNHQKTILRLAALLHDLGHYPYSHLIERIDKVKLPEEYLSSDTKITIPTSRPEYPDHAEIGPLLLDSDVDIKEAFNSDELRKDTMDLLGGRGGEDQKLRTLITSSMDLDRMDYLKRDAIATGVPYGQIDLNYLVNNLRVSPSGVIGLQPKALAAAEHFLLARFYMYRNVYYHKTTYGMEEVLRQLIRRLRDNGDKRIPADGKEMLELVQTGAFLGFTDAYIDQLVRDVQKDYSGRDDHVVKALAGSVLSRHPPKLLKEVSGWEVDTRRLRAGEYLIRNFRDRIQEVAAEIGLETGNFILCELKPLWIEKEETRRTWQEWNSLSPVDRQKFSADAVDLVKVFEADEAEPKSLAGIRHSIVANLKNPKFEIYRLYVVFNDSIQTATSDKLKEIVSNWDTLI